MSVGAFRSISECPLGGCAPCCTFSAVRKLTIQSHPTVLRLCVSALSYIQTTAPTNNELFHLRCRVLLFSQFTSCLDLIQASLEAARFPHLRLDGTTKTAERAAALDAFNARASPYFTFLLSTRAGGLGLNLQSADTVIIFDQDWNPEMDLQVRFLTHACATCMHACMRHQWLAEHSLQS